MTTLALTGATLVVDGILVHDRALVVANGTITAITIDVPSSAATVHLAGYTIVPGLIDLHVHGGGGNSFDDPNPAAHRKILDFHARHGVTTLQASLVSAFPDDVDRRLDALARTVKSAPTLHGVHLEGPHLTPSQCGAHDPATLRAPEPDEADRLLTRDGLVTMVTVAPELDGVPEFVKRLTDAGVVVAAGHSETRSAELSATMDNGLSHVTHLWSSQSLLVRQGPWRVPGLLEESLASDQLVCEIIADGHHLPAT